jgi:tRNA G37 N-methylase TrmD
LSHIDAKNSGKHKQIDEMRREHTFGKTSFRRSKEVEIFEWIAVKQLLR